MAAPKNFTPARGLTPKKLDEWSRSFHAQRFEVRDRQCPGLIVRVGTTGAVTFRWYAFDRAAKKHRNTTIGRYPDLSLPQAREKLGKMRVAQRTGVLEDFTAGDEITVAELGEKFLQHLEKRRRNPDDPRSSCKVARGYFDREVFPRIGNAPVNMVSGAACRGIIEAMVVRGKPAAASMVHQLLGQFFRYAEGLDLVQRNPAQALDRAALGAAPSAPRKRRLSLDEISAFWRAMEAESTPGTRAAKLALRVLLLTATRQGELIKAKCSDVDLDAATWTLPPANRKMKKSVEVHARDFVIPLSPLAVAIFRELKELAGNRIWVLPSPQYGGASGMSPGSLSEVCRNFYDPRTGDPAVFTGEPFTPHDLRRTARSCFTEKLGADVLIAERCLGHSVGGRVLLTYDTGDYLEQRRALLDKWAVYVEQLAHGSGAKVSFLGGVAK
jgi:integrase